jgi:Na+-driven multidrug efflux pump
MTIFAEPLALMYLDATNPDLDLVLSQTVSLMNMMLISYVLCGVMESLAGSLRGLGYSIIPMLVNLILTCGGRIIWVLFFFPLPIFNNLIGMYLIYPISWITAIAAHTLVLATSKKLRRSKTDIAIKENAV